MGSKSLYSQINLAPLLDVIFVTLFLVLLSVGTTARDTALEDEAAYAESLAQAEQVAQARATEISALSATATVDEQSVAALQSRIDELTGLLDESTVDLETAQFELSALEEAAASEEEALQDALEALATDLQTLKEQLDLAQQNAEVLETTNITLTTQLQQAGERVDEYGDQLEELEQRFNSSALEQAVSSIKSDFVDTYIDIYTIEIFRAGNGVSRLRVINQNGNETEEVVSTENQVSTFLDEELNPFDNDRTLIMFLTTSDSLYRHEQWVEDYLRENNYPFGNWRITGE